MRIELTEEQIRQFESDQYIDIQAGNCGVYIELDKDHNDKKVPLYFEIHTIGTKGNFKPIAYSIQELRKLEPLKPENPSWYHNDPLCPSCESYMLYKYEYCPKCGQKLDWSEKTRLR